MSTAQQPSLTPNRLASKSAFSGGDGKYSSRSLEGFHASVKLPPSDAGFWRQLRAFAGPALLVSVGYMDPGNWGTDLAAGAVYRYGLLWIIALSSFMAIFIQIIAARLGVVTGKDLAQACRDYYPKWARWPNWILCEVAIGACDLAEVLGSALALNLLFHIPLQWAVLITAFDVLLLLALQGMGMRLIEAVILALVVTIGGCYFIEIFVLPQTQPNFLEMGRALLSPGFRQEGMVVLAIGLIGATVMPHNLYLHSALVQSRKLPSDDKSKRRAIKFNSIDTVVALFAALLVNGAILVMAAIVFYGKDGVQIPGGKYIAFNANSDWIRDAYLTLAPLLGTGLASILFAVALLASGQSSTITGTLAGQVVMEGFMHWRIRPWIRRLITRTMAIIPAIFIIGIRGETNSVTSLINLSQVVLAMQLPLAMFPLLHFTSSKKWMGANRLGWFLLIVGWGSAILIIALDLYGLPDALQSAWAVIAGH
ncbi:MAG TPA: Nramp family divalent metal transporter [Pirellulales bacterium]|jgi:manganese transport protein|nr:Nramp family divalent metal transporter [Pirellulales bacterium]